MTQLIGRILRQPDTKRVVDSTADDLLNECYVYCSHATTQEVVEAIKEGLEGEGMGDLAGSIRETVGNSTAAKKRILQRRPKFRNLQIYLPQVNWVDQNSARPLDYERDVLRHLDWSKVKLQTLAERIAIKAVSVSSLMVKITLNQFEHGGLLETGTVQKIEEQVVFDPVFATRMMLDIIPNPWVARSIVGDLLNLLIERGFNQERLGALAGYILDEMRKGLTSERDRLAEEQFMCDVAEGRIQFRLRADRSLWRMPDELETSTPEGSPQMLRNSGNPLEKSLFAPVYQGDYNKNEAEFACYLDEVEALKWWHRNVAKADGYHLQGWRKNRVYPDFLFANTLKNGKAQLIVLETKGDQLAGNLDTQYKQKLLRLLSDKFVAEHATKTGELELVFDAGESVKCDLVLISEWKNKLHQIMD